MMYNACTWAPVKESLNNLDVVHRRHLKEILKIKWQSKITDENLYNITRTEPLSKRVEKSRLNMIGKVFRQSELNPARSALVFAHNLISSKETRGRRERHRKDLYDTIKEDLEKRKLNFNTVIDEAKDPQNWKNIKNLKSKPMRSERILSKNR